MRGSRMSPLEIERVPLSGTTLIEANAGTGKTWTITALFVRLLVEADLSVDRILVVTFTEAATAELRDRIRTRLAETRAAIERGNAQGDSLLAALLERLPDPGKAVLQLESALRNFDQAPIHTIHGFCQRVLADRAFESAMPFKTELLPDQSELLREIVDDFWRRQLHDASPLFARFVAAAKLKRMPFGPDSLRDVITSQVGKPYLELRGPAAHADASALERAYTSAYAEARRIWLKERSCVAKQLTDNPALNGNAYRRTSVPRWLDGMEVCLGAEKPSLVLFDRFDKFTPAGLRAGTRAGHRAPQHAFYDACARLRETHTPLEAAYVARLAHLKMALLEFANAELASRKQARQLQSYDDLLLELHKALHDSRAPELVSALRERYRAALIDEFQDTDPVQYGIFERIYQRSGLPVFFVGDPKQSIYSFRGADVFSYLAARRAAGAAYTLEMNWRSLPRLVEAVNLMFERVDAPFVLPDISYQPSRPAPGERGRLLIDGEKGSPLEIWFASSRDGEPIGKIDARELAAEATAAEIARLMSLGAKGRARIVAPPGEIPKDRNLRGGDIAVLVRTHAQAAQVREALTERGVASVQRGAENVFASDEAEELERVLLAISEPSREPLLSGALATEIIGYSADQLSAVQADESQWEGLVETFRDAQREWHDGGFIRMLRSLFQHFNVVCRLLENADGERRVTNLLHLTELLHCEAGARGMSGLIAWLAAKRRVRGVGNEEELLRLESDENLVKILTIHVAKGLEFPLVFCPFMWDGHLWAEDADVIRFHDPRARLKPVLDFGSADFDAAREQASREERAENLRLLYVALTRAKYRCWMIWGHIAGAATSAPAWLLHKGQPTLDPQTMRADLAELEKSAGGRIRVTPLGTPAVVVFKPAAERRKVLAARRFGGVIRDSRRVTSFTGLTHGRPIETPDYDAGDRPQEPDVPIGGRDIFAFPRGAHAGKCLHAIFEHVDFANAKRDSLDSTVRRDLDLHGFDTEWVRAVSDMIEAVLATPLDESGMRLDQVTRSHRLDELEFYYPVNELADRHVREILLECGFPDEIRERIGDLTFSTTHGYMRGFIDLVFEHGGRFYLADYKSNWLGATVNAYQQPQLTRAMAREAYYLQYLVYCVALHRYLGGRVRGYRYDAHFGGVRYLFVRGMRPDLGATCGVYADRPSEGLVHALDEYLSSGMRLPARPGKPVQGRLDL
jgi:exodeoxyribonuclease V beta subunit